MLLVSTKCYLVVGLKQMLVVGNVLHLVQEPAVDLGELVQLIHRVTGSERSRQNEDTLIGGSLQLLQSIRRREITKVTVTNKQLSIQPAVLVYFIQVKDL